MKKLLDKRLLVVVLLVVFGFVSFFGFSKIATDSETYGEIYRYLGEKETAVLGMSAATGAASIALAAVPGDSTTPLANKIADMTSYLLLIVGVIVLEKVLLTVVGGISCYALIPLACLLWIFYIYIRKESLKAIAVKASVVALVLLFLVPASVWISNSIDKAHETMEKIKPVTQAADTLHKEIKDEEQKQGGWWSAVVEKAKKTWDKVKDKASDWVDRGQNMLNRLVDAIAVLIITSCVIPLLVLGGFLWLFKYIFGIKVSVSDMQKKVKGAILPQKEEEKVAVEKE